MSHLSCWLYNANENMGLLASSVWFLCLLISAGSSWHPFFYLWWEITEAWCFFGDWRHTHTCLTPCLRVFLFANSLQFLFLIEFAPPAGAPGKERRCQRLTVSLKKHISASGTESFYQSGSCLIVCFSFLQSVRWSLILRSERRRNPIMKRWVVVRHMCL